MLAEGYVKVNRGRSTKGLMTANIATSVQFEQPINRISLPESIRIQ